MRDLNDITPAKILVVLAIAACIIASLSVFTGCGITKSTTHNCELMEQGQKCLPDHSCCK